MALYDIINYFYGSNSKFNRITWGFKSPTFIKWRITDFILIIVLIVLFFVTSQAEPFHRQFYLNDMTIQHPFAEHERVTNIQLGLYSTVIPLSVIIIVALISTCPPKYKLYNTWVSSIGLLLSILITSFVTNIVKNWFGRLRPDFLDRCQPANDTPKDKLVSIEVCTTDNLDRLADGFRTTPSGHSSISFAGLFYLTLFLLGQSQANNGKTSSWRTMISFIPWLMACYIALSRTQDYRHHFIDVFVGSCLGLIIAIWQYFRLFPWFGGNQANDSFNNRIMIEEIKRKEEIKQDENNYRRISDISTNV